MSDQEEFAEALPLECPPSDAESGELGKVFRLVPDENPTEVHFASFQALRGPRPNTYTCSDCEWASSSLRNDLTALLELKGLRKRNKYVAQLNIPAGSGKHKTKGTHVDFWKFSSFSIANAVEKTWGHGQ